MQTIKNYVAQNKQRFLDELFELLRFPSVSADPAYKTEVLKTADFVAQKLTDAGADKVEVCPTAGYPMVYGEKIIDPAKPTVLVYGHYDVQPADPLELWHTPPFEPTLRDEKIYARGACDDKGQFYMHVKAFELMMQTDTLPCNIKFMIEGEEEVGSNNLGLFVYSNLCIKHIHTINNSSVLKSKEKKILQNVMNDELDKLKNLFDEDYSKYL